jgi:hypothetical protein
VGTRLQEPVGRYVAEHDAARMVREEAVEPYVEDMKRCRRSVQRTRFRDARVDRSPALTERLPANRPEDPRHPDDLARARARDRELQLQRHPSCSDGPRPRPVRSGRQ